MKKIIMFFSVIFMLTFLVACNGEKESFQVSFDENYPNGPSVLVITLEEGELVNRQPDPTRQHYTFINWFLDDEPYDFNTPVTKDIVLKARWQGILEISGQAEGLIGDYGLLSATLAGEKLDSRSLVWTSSEPEIISVDGGVARYHQEGTATITVENEGVTKDFEITVEKRNENHLMQYFIDNAKNIIPRETIKFRGSDNADDTNLNPSYNFYASVVDYRFNDPLDIVVDLLDRSEPNHPNTPLFSLEWIVVHDTANVNAGALANHNWIHNSGNTGTSWHYTVGTDGWFNALDDLDVGWHAGDGSAAAGFTDTGIPATRIRPKMTISDDGYYVILDEKTEVKAPLIDGKIAKTSDITEAGIWPVIIDGTYHIPNNRVSSGFGQKIVINGGNRNGIGIETSVLKNSDIFVTWHRTAKLVAHLLITHDLDFDRVVFHNHFSNKPCPRTAMESGNWDVWLRMMEFEHHILKYYSDYTIEFESLTPDVLDDTGRILNPVKSNTTVEYKIIITSPEGNVVEHTFSALVNPK